MVNGVIWYNTQATTPALDPTAAPLCPLYVSVPYYPLYFQQTCLLSPHSASQFISMLHFLIPSTNTCLLPGSAWMLTCHESSPYSWQPLNLCLISWASFLAAQKANKTYLYFRYLPFSPASDRKHVGIIVEITRNDNIAVLHRKCVISLKGVKEGINKYCNMQSMLMAKQNPASN